MLIEKDMYVRYTYKNKTLVGKVVDIEVYSHNTYYIIAPTKYKRDAIRKGDEHHYIIGKPSYNIIDALRPNDYVNGYRVNKIKNNRIFTREYYYEQVYYYPYDEELRLIFIDPHQIKTIVTKECFEDSKCEVEYE